MNSSDFLVSLGEIGNLFYKTMIGRLDSGNYPPSEDDPRKFFSIQDATYVESPKFEGGTASISIIINVRKAPYARAYEWGSGEHGPMGSTYPINPRNAPFMTFPEDDWPGWEDWGGYGAVPIKGAFFLTHVEHPGVEAKPYIQPSIDEIRDQVRKKLVGDFKVSLLRGGKKVEVITV